MTKQNGESGPAGTREQAVVVSLLAVVVVLVVVLVSSSREDPKTGEQSEDSSHRNLSRSAQYVGSQACRRCHREIAAGYDGHPMAHTLSRINDAQPIEDFATGLEGFTVGNRSYRVERQGKLVVHFESMIGDDTRPLYEQGESISFAIGAGAKGRSFLLQRKGLFFESPITWYTRKKVWDLSPGYPPGLHYRFSRRVGDDCLACHAGRVAVEPEATVDRYVVDQPFLEESIGCERCHGPGSEHVALYGSTDGMDITDSRIVNPAKLSATRQEDVCNQCHLEGRVRILGPGRRFADFRPGQSLSKTWTVFVGRAPVDAQQRPLFTSHVEQMHASHCYLESGGKLGCISCHDPHRVPTASQREVFYRERCQRCHSDRGCSLPEPQRRKSPAADSCIACHMPRVHSSDVAHTVQADHRILRQPPTTRAADGLVHEMDDQPWQIFGRTGELPLSIMRRAEGIAWFKQAVTTQDARLLETARLRLTEVLEQVPDDIDVRRVLGLIAFRQDPPTARKIFETVLGQRPDDEVCLSHLVLICYLTRDDRAGVGYARRLLTLNPFDGEAHGPYADMLEAAGDLGGAIEAAEQGIRLDPTVLDLRRSLARFYHKAGRDKAAREQERLVEEIGKRLGKQ